MALLIYQITNPHKIGDSFFRKIVNNDARTNSIKILFVFILFQV